MKKIILLCLIFSLMLNINANAAENKDKEKNSMDVKAIGAVLIDCKTGRVLWGQNETAPLAMASTTKIMTAIVALENGNLDDIVTISKRAASAPDVQMNLTSGEKIKLEYLMYALMLQSFNDAAIAIAEHIGTTVEQFCQMMTEKAKEIGAVDTIFETPNGLDAGNHHSTALDMALITKYALENKKFIEITNVPEINVKSDKREYSLYNKNRLLREYDGALGVKTGFTGKAGHCFVGAAKRGDMQLVSVVLGSGWGNKGKEQKWVDTKQLLNYGFNNFKYKTIINKDDLVGSILVKRSKTEKIDVFFNESLEMPLTDDEVKSIEVSVSLPDSILAPIEANKQVGVATIAVGGKVVKEVPLLASESAERHDFKTSLEKVIKEWIEMGTFEDVKVLIPEMEAA